MSVRIRKNLTHLKKLLKSSPLQRRIILQTASDELILTLCEVALNTLRGTIPLTSGQYRKLEKKKNLIKLIADKKIGVLKKRQTINQQGGFILPLLSVAIPFISSIIASRQG